MLDPTKKLNDREYRALRSQVLERINLVSIQLFETHPLFWALMGQLGKIDATGYVPTMAVGYRGKDPTVFLLYNVHYVAAMSDLKLRFVIIHELMHVGLCHLARIVDLDRQIANLAADLIVNEANIAEYQKIPDEEQDAITMHWPKLKRTIEEDGTSTFEPHPQAGELMFPVLKDVVVRDSSMEEIYLRLQSDPQSLQNFMKGMGAGEFGAEQHEHWGSGVYHKDGLTDEQKAAGEKLVKDAIAQLGGKDPGNVPGELRRLIDEIRKVRHNWRRELTLFAQSVLQDDRESSWRRYNRRLGAASPGHTKKYRARILIAVDNSGSINGPIYNLFMSHIAVLSEILEEVMVIGCDTRINFQRAIKGGKIPDDMDLSSGGGTCFQPPFDFARENDFDGLIYLSDGEGAPPVTYGKPAIFALCPGGREVPGLRNIRIED